MPGIFRSRGEERLDWRSWLTRGQIGKPMTDAAKDEPAVANDRRITLHRRETAADERG
jgi:hypothetical protein